MSQIKRHPALACLLPGQHITALQAVEKGTLAAHVQSPDDTLNPFFILYTS